MTAQPKYKFPGLAGRKVIYNGRRFKVIELSGESGDFLLDRSYGGFVMWDGLYAGHVATMTQLDSGGWKCSLNSHIELCFEYTSLKEAVAGLQKEMNRYSNTVVGR